MSKYVLKIASMPGKLQGNYKRIGIIEMEKEGLIPKMISARAVGVKRIVQTWERLYAGTTENCAFRKALKEAEAVLAELRVKELHVD